MMHSCGPSKSVSFNITQPAEITMPPDVNTLLLVDRTKFSNEMVNILEGILTGEMPADDRIAAQEAMMRLKGKLDMSPRYNVKIHPDRLIGNNVTAVFPEALKWNVIEQLCAKYQAEAVVALEVFDSNFIITNGSRIKKKHVGEGKEKKEVEYTEYYAQGVGKIKMGIRTYYPKDRQIVDQQFVDRSNSWEAAGTNPSDALRVLITKSAANKQLAGMVGDAYAYKISPMPVRISRDFYSKGKDSPDVAQGSRFADVAQWKEAIDVWKKGLSSANEKDAGRLAYNIAVANEVIGEYGTALHWAQEAYTKYGNILRREYVPIIQSRIEEEKRLQQQMK
ncbi:MAG: hypothetical protein DWQ48_01945 [Bacteroidetes bacterium]|nr:MAG: hypothetical protein DWQ48_01945 [Bacteroidota bacterium]